MTFKLQQRPDLLLCRADQTHRNKDDGSLRYDDLVYFRSDGEEGVFSGPESYMKVIHSLLKRDDLLLKADTIKPMFQASLNSRLEKTTQLTKKIQACLSRLEATGKSVKDVSGPLNGETKKLQTLGNSESNV